MPLPNPRAGDAEVQRNFRGFGLDLAGIRRSIAALGLDAGTSFPASPTDGEFFVYNADTTNGVKWMFQYRSASASAYKWEFVGGGDLFDEILTRQGRTAATYAGLTTAGPSLTAPLAGDYFVTIGAVIGTNAAGAAPGRMSYKVGADSAVDNDSLFFHSSGQYDFAPGARQTLQTGIAASTIFLAQYKADNATIQMEFEKRWMTLVPIRVSA